MRLLPFSATLTLLLLFVASPVVLRAISTPTHVVVLLSDADTPLTTSIAKSVEEHIFLNSRDFCLGCEISLLEVQRNGINAILLVPASNTPDVRLKQVEEAAQIACTEFRSCDKIAKVSLTPLTPNRTVLLGYAALVVLGIGAAVYVLIARIRGRAGVAEFTPQPTIHRPLAVAVLAWASASAVSALFGETPKGQPISTEALSSQLPILLIAAPLAEEFFFRYWMLRQAAADVRSAPIIALSMLGFVFSHAVVLGGSTLSVAAVDVLQLMLLGGGLTWLWLRERSFLSCAVAHAGFNAMALFI